MFKSLVKVGLVLGLSIGSLSADGWFIAPSCQNLMDARISNPNRLITDIGCKPVVGGDSDEGAKIGILGYDCQNTKLKTFYILIYGSKEKCVNTFQK